VNTTDLKFELLAEEYSRILTREVNIGGVALGGLNPIRIQSMTNTDTLNTKATIAQSIRMIEAGCEYVRITAPGIKEAENLKAIHDGLRKAGYQTPLIADIHYNPRAAEIAAQYVEKVRINPGNYTDRKTGKLDFTDAEYQNEIEKIRERLKPLIGICNTNGTAMRIGSNHGSLSERIMSRYGDTPMGMAVAAMEFISICEDLGFHDLVVSMKASNPRVMVEATRLVVALMNANGTCYPLHLGVTEAGDAAEGRVKSAAGISCLLEDGVGDTIRVSLTEDPEKELPVAKLIVDRYNNRLSIDRSEKITLPINPFSFSKRVTRSCGIIGGPNLPIVMASQSEPDSATFKPDMVINQTESDHNVNSLSFVTISQPALLSADMLTTLMTDQNTVLIAESNDQQASLWYRQIFAELIRLNIDVPVILKKCYDTEDLEAFLVHCGADMGTLFADGLGDGIWLESPHPHIRLKLVETTFSILQATRSRISQTEFISCPSCGRTLYNIQEALAKVKAATRHLKGLKVAVMGCVVNGPGEMADADYGYVGSGKGRVNLYRRKEVVVKNIEEEHAVDKLVDLIKGDGKWVEAKV
jgi:(E)-4-hydroxy-3-methylbut-2-enyl-diphosphate synthase